MIVPTLGADPAVKSTNRNLTGKKTKTGKMMAREAKRDLRASGSVSPAYVAIA